MFIEKKKKRGRETYFGCECVTDADNILIIVTDLWDENPTVIDVRVTSAEFDIPATRVSLVMIRYTFLRVVVR